MRSLRYLAAAVSAACAFASPAWAAPLSAYGGLPTIDAINISPDGSKLAVVVSDGETRSVVIRGLVSGDSKAYGIGAAKVRDLDWVGADYLVISTTVTGRPVAFSGPKQEFRVGYGLDLKTHKVEPLLKQLQPSQQTGTHRRDPSMEIGGALNVMASAPMVRTIEGKPRLFLTAITLRESWWVPTIVEADLRSGDRRIVDFGSKYINQMLLGPDGKVVARAEFDDDAGRWTLKARSSAGWKVVHVVDNAKLERPYLVGLGRAEGALLIAEPDDSGHRLREISADGAPSAPLPVHDADDVILDPVTRRPIGLYDLSGDEGRYTFFDANDQKAWEAVKAAFKGDRVSLQSWTHDRRKIVVRVDSAAEGPAFALVDLATRKAEWLGAEYETLMPEDLSKVQAVRFKAADGLELTGYLTLPNGRAAKDLPLVVLPHGGPQSRDMPGFDWWPQAIASRGYAVLQVNFRGSDGFGRSFVEAGYGQWGRKMQTDLSDGVRHLVAQGVVDPKRVCIVGASYGGYAALAGATLDRGVYRCAASVAGLSDLRRLVEDEGRSAQRYWKRFMGVQKLSDPALAEISPLTHVDKVSIPVLLVHGRDDTVVPLEQSEIMADALRKAGKPAELVVLAGEDHWLSRGQTRREMLEATMAFVEKHNPAN